MRPFDAYPDKGRKMLGMAKGSTTRHDHFTKLRELTGQTSCACAYCGMSLIDSYEHWFMITLDHVVPRKAGAAIGISSEWLNDYANIVLCCSACNDFANRYTLPENTKCPETCDEFFILRDKIFAERKQRICEKRRDERKFFDDNFGKKV